MGFNRRKLEAEQRAKTDAEAARRRATEAQVLEDAERLIAAWNERRPTECRYCFHRRSAPPSELAIGFCGYAVQRAGQSAPLTCARHPDAAVTSLIPALSCRSCRPNAPFAELVRLSGTSIADEMREEHRRRVLGE
jgi:hypothetical protein